VTELRRTLDFRRLTLIVVGTVIGSGIFIVPAQTLQLVGARLPVSLAIWTAGGVLSLLGAFTYAEMGAMKPEAGGLYVYIRDTFGARAAFLYGWVLFLVICPATVAALTTASAAYAQEFIELTPYASKSLAAALTVVMVAINILGARGSANVVGVATLLKAAMIVVLSAGLIAFGHAPAVAPADLPPATGIVGAGAAMIGVLWAYEGWQWATFSAGEAIDPQRTVPRALVIGTALLVALYLLANVAYSTALGPIAVSHSSRVAAEAATDAQPYTGYCETITPDYHRLVGTNLGKGFRKAVQDLLGSVRGCTHLNELLGQFPTAAMQTMAGEQRDIDDTDNTEGKPFPLDRCHALDTHGEGVRRHYPRWYRGAKTGTET